MRLTTAAGIPLDIQIVRSAGADTISDAESPLDDMFEELRHSPTLLRNVGIAPGGGSFLALHLLAEGQNLALKLCQPASIPRQCRHAR